MFRKNKILIFGGAALLIGAGLLMPVLSHAQGGFLTGLSNNCYNNGDCNFCDIGRVAANIFKFLRNDIAFPLAILMIIYGGIMMIFSAGSTARVATGRKILTAAVIGFAIVVGVSLILNTVLIIVTKSQFNFSTIFSGGIQCLNPQ